MNASVDDRQSWISGGWIGGKPQGTACSKEDPPRPILGTGEVADLRLEMERGAATFLKDELIDPGCVERGTFDCREFAVSVGTKFGLELEPGVPLPLGHIKLRPIIVASFFVDLL